MKKGKKSSGGRYKKSRKKKLYELGRQTRVVKLGEKKTKVIRGRGGDKKIVSLSQKEVNVMVKGKAKKTLIKTVVETPSNRFLARQNILVKGAIIETGLGRARITNRPSQEGIVQAEILAEEKQ